MTGGETLEQRLIAMAEAIDAARRSVAAGATVDLSALEAAVRAVHDDIARAPATDNRAELERLVRRVLADLDDLASALDEQHRRAVDGLGLGRAARAAYGNENDPPAVDAGGDGDDGDGG